MIHWRLTVAGPALVAIAAAAGAQSEDHHHHHDMTGDGVVMNANLDRLPRGCPEISGDVALTIEAGRAYAARGRMFGMSQHDVRVPPCSRLTVTFVNDDAVRHQWMIHGLPKYLYPAGMFHIEAMGGSRQAGTFIVPAEDRTYLIHCDIAQHMEMGMRGQLVVGAGSGDLWGVPGVSDDFYRDAYLRAPGMADGWTGALRLWMLLVAAGILGFLLTAWLGRRRKRRF